MKILFNLLLLSFLPICLFGQLETDNDKDGMDDTWEIENQLNPDDPHDAWCDLDGDQVLNIFEFQLKADPRNANSPSVKLLTSSTTQKEFIDLVHQSAKEPLLLKLAAGVYDIGFKRIELEESAEKYKPLKLMVQGGWNSDFSEYNPFAYRTIVDGQNDKDKNFNLTAPFTGNQIAGLRESLIYDGIEFTRGGLSFSNFLFHASYSIYNCSIYDTNSSFYFNTSYSSAPTNVYLVNSTFANNREEGNIHINSGNSIINVTMINSTVTNNGDNQCPAPPARCIDDVTEGIFYHSTSPNGATFNVTNSIIWQEGAFYGVNTYQSQYYRPNLSPLIFNFKNSNVAAINQNENTKVENYEHVTNVNPVFSSLSTPHLELSTSSPLKEAGINVGLPFAGSAPDLGVNKFVVNGSCQVPEGEQPTPPITEEPKVDCTVEDPFSLEFIKTALSSDGIYTANDIGAICLFVEEIVQIEYQGLTYYRMTENFNSAAACPIQTKNVKFYDCEGNFVGGIGDIPTCESPTLCDALATAGGTVIWAYEKKLSDSSIFNDYPWVNDIVDPTKCSIEEVEAYEVDGQVFVFILKGVRDGRLYLEDGTLYCANTNSYDCVTPFNIDNLLKFWTCRDSNVKPISQEVALTPFVSTVSAFPNPTTGALSIQLPSGDKKQHIRVMNMLGNTVYEEQTSDAGGTLSIDLSRYENGLYFLEWSNGIERQTKRILKQSAR